MNLQQWRAAGSAVRRLRRFELSETYDIAVVDRVCWFAAGNDRAAAWSIGDPD